MPRLSRLVFNPVHRGARSDLAAPYELHRTLGKAFPQATTNRYRSECGVLFRIEPPQPNASGPVVLVQSEAAPAWEGLPPGYMLEVSETTLDLETLNQALEPGRRFRFRLAANPSRRWKEGDGKPGSRYPLLRELEPEGMGYLDWLVRQADRHGFALNVLEGDDDKRMPDVSHVPFHVAPRRRKARRGDARAEEAQLEKKNLPLFGVRFDGVLQVTDQKKLADAVRKGIGPAKAFGFGLLSLAPR